MMAQPPTTSFASAYGPSTRLTSPWRTTKLTASSVPYRPPPSRNTPLAARSPMWASIASNNDCGGVPTPSSILTKPMKRGILTTPTGCWGCFHTYVERLPGASTSTSTYSSARPRAYYRRPMSVTNEPVPFEVYERGGYLHGTKADLAVGELLVPGRESNFEPGRMMNYIY